MAIDVNPDWWRTLFDDVYLITDARSVCDPEVTRREVDLVCRLLDLEPHQQILDLCGGHGRHVLELGARGFTRCTLLDYSPYLTDLAEKETERLGLDIRIVRADARHSGLPAGSFDHVLILGNSLGYLPEDDADRCILREAYRVLDRGGRILVDVADGGAVRSRLNPVAWHEIGDDVIVCRRREISGGRVRAREVVLSKEGGLLRDQTYSIKLYDRDSLANLLEGAGFQRVEVHTDFTFHARAGDYGCMNNRMMGAAQRM